MAIRLRAAGTGSLADHGLSRRVAKNLLEWQLYGVSACPARHHWADRAIHSGNAVYDPGRATCFPYYTGVGTKRQGVGLATSTDMEHWVMAPDILLEYPDRWSPGGPVMKYPVPPWSPHFYVWNILQGPDGEDCIFAWSGDTLGKPYPLRYEADGRLEIGQPVDRWATP